MSGRFARIVALCAWVAAAAPGAPGAAAEGPPEPAAQGQPAAPAGAPESKAGTTQERSGVPAAAPAATDPKPDVTAASRVSLKLDDVTPAAALAALSKQTGYTLRGYDEQMWQHVNLPKLSLDLKDQPFWSVVREVCGKGNIAPYPHSPGGGVNTLTFIPTAQWGGASDLLACPAHVNGAFMFVATNVQRNSSVVLTTPRTVTRSLSVELQVFAEPKVRVLQYDYRPDVTEAVDENGRSLAPERGGPGRTTGSVGQRAGAWNMSVPLRYATDTGRRLARLKGVVKLTVQVGSESATFDDVMDAKDQAKDAGARRAVLKGVRHIDDNQYEVTLVFPRAGGPADPAEFQNGVENPTLQLLDADGRAFQFGGSNGIRDDDGEQLTAAYTFFANGPQNGRPVKLVWEVATGSREITVPFEFSDLPLP